MLIRQTISRLVLAAVCVFAAGSLSCLPLLEGDEAQLLGQEVKLTFLHTSDIHSRLIPYDFSPLKTDVDLGLVPDAAPFGGAARMASVLKRERKNADRIMHLDSGDCFQGAPIFNTNTGEAEFKFLTQAKLDAAVVGNHEFDAGARNFAEKARDVAGFPLLAANYVWEDHRGLTSHQSALYTAPYSVHNIKGVRVGVIGMANISSLNSIVEGGNSLQATPLEQNEVARAYVDILRPAVDIIVAVSHLGLHEDQDLIRGYEAYYKYKKAKQFIDRTNGPGWQILEWFGPEGDDESVVRVQIPGVSGIDVVLGGHLHVVLNPPQTLTDPSGRKVVLAHSGAFSKYVGRLDTLVRMPNARGLHEGAEVISHDYRVFPLDAVWCDDAIHDYYKAKFWGPGAFAADQKVKDAIAKCTSLEDAETLEILEPYILKMDLELGLTTIFSYAPRDVARRNNSTGGDSPLGNIAADSMRLRQRVEAELALTNSLGIRDNLYAGPVNEESMFNVFPFENTINIMYLSGVELQELFDFVSERSAGRGCQSQAQVSGVEFTMDCAQAQLNDLRTPCIREQNGADCPQVNREGRSPWQCIDDGTGDTVNGRCWAHSAIDISIRGKPLSLNETYKIAVNDYIAKGGSGFSVLKRNTTRIETGISLRDSLIGYMQGFCNCRDIVEGKTVSKAGLPCGTRTSDGTFVVDDQVKAYCKATEGFEKALATESGTCNCRDALMRNEIACGPVTEDQRAQCAEIVGAGPTVGTCGCREVLAGDTNACGNITLQLRQFCSAPMSMPVAIGYEDNRIKRRVK